MNSHQFKKIIPLVLCMATTMVAMSFSVKPAAKLNVIFSNYVGDSILKPDVATYKNELKQSFTVTNFKYYIGHIHLQKAGGSSIDFNGYYLVDEEDDDSKKIPLGNIPAGTYSSITFTIGVDSIDNCSGAQSGALDPIHAMFWAWNTGYIFVKLEGKAPASQSPGHIFEYHIGGYRTPYNCVRQTKLAFTTPLIIDNTNKEIYIKTDIAELLKTPVSIDFSKLSSVTDFHNSTTIADNYKDMFSILEIR